MHNSSFPERSVFCPFEDNAEIDQLATNLSFSLENELHPLCRMAASRLQDYLQQQQDWVHNFGLSAESTGTVSGKMFGVLVVRTREGQLGYLSGFSGKLAGKNDHDKFVPPIFDGLEAGGFLNAGMEQLSGMSNSILELESQQNNDNTAKIRQLKAMRKDHSQRLQTQLFEQYHFINKAGESKGLIQVFRHTAARKPSAGAGECAAPKLLQYAFSHHMEPLALAEFWWGLSPKSAQWKHGHFYPPCEEKCAPILAHMLS